MAKKLTAGILIILLLLAGCAQSPAETPTPTPEPEPIPSSEPELLKLVGQVGGPTQAVAVQGDYAYVGVGLRLVVLDVSKPTILREIGTTQPFEGFVEGMAVVDDIAYVTCGGAGLYLVDTSNPAHPIQIAVYDSLGYAEGVAVAGRYAYVADGWAGLRVVDISDPARPAEVGSVYTLGYAFDVAIAGNYAYVAGAGAGLRVVDISDPTHLSEVGSYDTPGYAHDIAVADNIAYIADEWEGVRVLDVSDPAHPAEVGFYDTPGQAFGVAVSDSKVYVADAFAGLRVVDISNPATPHEVGAYEVKGHAGQVAVAGGIAYVADCNWGLRAVDVSDPVHPTQVGFFGPLGYAHDVAVAGEYAYVAAAYYGLRVVDISDPSHPIQVGVYDTPGYAISVAVAGNYAYVATMGGGTEAALHVVDISNPTQPIRAGLFQAAHFQPRDMVFAEGIVYIPDESGLRLISVSDPLNPTQLGFIEIHGPTWPARGPCAVGVAVSGNLAYVAVEQAGLKIVDVSDPSNPSLVGEVCDEQDFWQEVAVAGHYAYMATGDGLRVVNVSDPAHPALVGFYDTPGEGCGIVMSGDTAYVAGGGGGLQAVDVSDPSNPTLAGSYNTRSCAHKVTVVGNHVFVADGNGGMLALKIVSDTGINHTPSKARLEIPERSHKNISQFPVQFALSLGSIETRSIYLVTPGQGGSSTGYRPDKYHNEACPIRPQPDGLALYSTGRTLTVTSAADSGPGTLRWCLQNAVSGDTIVFDSSVFPPGSPVTITLSEELPEIDQGNITIDASDAGVILDGSKVTGKCHYALGISSDGNIIRGLQILNFPETGVGVGNGAKYNIIGGDRTQGSGPMGEGNLISGNGGTGIYAGDGSNNNVIVGNFIGVDATGLRALGNRGGGVMIRASHNRIGGNGTGERNIISGNGCHGVSLAEDGTTGNIVVGNYIGTDASGTADLGNESIGVSIELGAFNNLVQGNLISGNSRGGILIHDSGSSYNTVVGNFIGTDVSGTLPIPNQAGVGIGGMASFNRIGGTTAAERNIISGNQGGGISVGRGGRGNLVMGNYIGTDISGTKAVGNVHGGIDVSYNSQRVFIGGVTERERNVISGNGRWSGIHIVGSGTDYNWVAGNYIGIDASGTKALGNEMFGVTIGDSAEYNVIQGNLISSNETGICINYAADSVVFHNNLIDNKQNGSDNTGTNFWDYNGEGNYWSDYTGRDGNGDGIGDIPYQIPGGSGAKDSYPLMEPSGYFLGTFIDEAS